MAIKFSILFFLICISANKCFSLQSIRLNEIKVLTLYSNKFTTNLESQLTCVANCFYSESIKSVQCENKGFDGSTIQWKCETNDLPQFLTFDEIKIKCSGFNDKYEYGDYVVVGSCRLEYSLRYYSSYSKPSNKNVENNEEIPPLVIVIFCIIIFFNCKFFSHLTL